MAMPGRFPMNIASTYHNRMKSRIEEMHKETYNAWENEMKRYYNRMLDSPDEDLEETIERLKAKHMISAEAAREMAEDIIDRVRKFSIHQVDDQIRAVAGVSPNLRHPRASERLNLIIKENVRLITSLNDKYYGEVERVIEKGVLEGRSINKIREGLKKASNSTITNSKIIARDQVGSALAEVTRQRQTQIGIEHYIWSSVGDEKVRDNHEEWDGQRFSWKEGSPNGTHPGQEINCRCIAQPDRKEILDIYEV